MREYDYDIGNVTFILTGKYRPLRRRSDDEISRVATELSEKVSALLNEDNNLRQFGGTFVVQEISVLSGCILVKLKVLWKKANDFTKDHLQLPAFLLAVASTINTYFPVERNDIELNSTPVTCQIQRGETALAKDTIHIKKGQTLYSSLKNVELKGFSFNQLMVATFEANPNCFIGEDINKVKAFSALLIPSPEVIKGISSSHANRIIEKSNN